MTTPTFLKLKSINVKCLKYQTRVGVAVDYHLSDLSSKPQACLIMFLYLFFFSIFKCLDRFLIDRYFRYFIFLRKRRTEHMYTHCKRYIRTVNNI